MPNTASLTVSISANTQGLTKGLDRATNKVRGFSSTLTAGGAALIGLGTGAALGAASGLGSFATQAFDSIDATTELASRLGVGVKFLSGLQHSAELAGASSESLGTGFQFFNAILGKAISGSRSAQTAFTQLGLDFNALVKAGPEEAFLQTAEAISRLTTAAEKATAVKTLFSRGGTALLDVFAGGRGRIQADIEQAVKIGRAFNEVDAARIGEADNALIRAKGAAAGLTNSLTSLLSPAIAFIADEFSQTVEGFTSLGSRAKKFASELFGTTTDAAKDAKAEAEKVLKGEFRLKPLTIAPPPATPDPSSAITSAANVLANQEKRLADIGSAIQIDPTRTAFGVAAAAPRVQEVTSPQLQQLITLSNQQLTAFKQGFTVQ